MARKALGQVLLEMNALSERDLESALERLRSLPGRRLGEYLVSEGIISERTVAQALARQFDLPFETADGLSVDRNIARMVSEEYARRQRALPFSENGGTLMVAMVDPMDVYTLDDIAFVSGLPVQAVVVTSDTLETLIKAAFSGGEATEAVPARNRTPPAPGPGSRPPLSAFPPREQEPVRPPGFSSEAPAASEPAAAPRAATEETTIVKLTDDILLGAVEQGASDIHVEAMAEQVRVRYRIDGVLRDVRRLDKALHAGLVSRIKILAGADISEKRLPQDARFEMEVGGRNVDLRVSTLPTIHGEKVVLRILDKTRGIPSLSSLGLNPNALRRFREVLRSSYGMILCCGPTGAGKTTTIISALQDLNSPGVNVVTIEDPVEYELEGVNHVAVNARAGLTFASGLRSMLRQDPDIIFLGEIRDAETAEIATRASLTGHLLLSTIHTNDAAGAITRLVDMKVERFLVASTMMGVLSQRLVRRLCPRCKQPYVLKADDPHRYALGLPDQPLELYRARGCNDCQNTGYRGRVGLFEVLVVNPKVRDMIINNGTAEQIKQVARETGMQTLLEDGIEKALQGLTSLDEVLRMTFVE